LTRGVEPIPGLAVTKTGPPPTEWEAFAEDSNEFSLALFGQLGDAPGNLLFSPFSLRTVLAMAYSGARGETARQMREVLRIGSADDRLHVNYSEIIHRLNTGSDGEYEMLATNSLWVQRSEPLVHAFLDLIDRHYRGNTSLVDFRQDAEAARRAINQWVEAQTRQKIRDLIPVGGLDATTSLALVNAVYFKGMWALPFDRADTSDEVFRLAGGGRVKAPLMHQEEIVPYSEGKGFQAVDLVYEGGDLSMLVLLPGRKNGLPDLEKRLSAGMLRDCVAKVHSRRVKLFLPRFTFVWGTVDLTTRLKDLGMPLAFSELAADFSGMNGQAPPSQDSLFLSSVFHQAHLEVNEEGTEAAAATAANLLNRAALGPSIPPTIPVFRADHPFLFAIRDRKSGLILFLGRVSDPTLHQSSR